MGIKADRHELKCRVTRIDADWRPGEQFLRRQGIHSRTFETLGLDRRNMRWCLQLESVLGRLRHACEWLRSLTPSPCSMTQGLRNPRYGKRTPHETLISYCSNEIEIDLTKYYLEGFLVQKSSELTIGQLTFLDLANGFFDFESILIHILKR